ncbi:MAG: IscS subfamily cysteine desulfurase [Candidatus Sumerlaeia bacterium]|nr:IscS subfamily cysteine desulfurase [Candidatus Sumerlaeia bacterium]
MGCAGLAPMKRPIYLDNHATTPVDPRVLEAMLPTFSVDFGNPASPNHAYGWEAEERVQIAREQVAAVIGAEPEEIIFTSGATESDNLAIRGTALAQRPRGSHIITAATEHRAVLDPCARLAREGFHVTVLPVQSGGLIDLAALEASITDETTLISIMAANNEIGVLQPLHEIGALARARGALFHTDAVQAFGKVPLDVDAAKIDLLSISAHKVYGPKGVGALYVRRRGPRVRLTPLIDGGGHERGLRSGTLNVSGIVGLGRAAELAAAEMDQESRRLRLLRDRLLGRLREGLPEVHVNGTLDSRLPGNLNVSFGQLEGEALLLALSDIALSTGSACTSAQQEPSHVLKALGLSEAMVKSSVRFGIGRFNTVEEIDFAASRVADEVRRLLALSPLTAHRQAGLDSPAEDWPSR